MATPRASVLWLDSQSRPPSSYFPEYDEDEDGEAEEMGIGGPPNGRTRLDRTIDRIGMGSYQWILLSLCGFGWMADNMWIQAMSIILPRVQNEYAVPDQYIGILSSCMFAGMMVGAIGWGACSDLMGRTVAFNGTLFLTSVFGLCASFVSSFPVLCVVLFLLGSSVGGSMPTDGTLLLEHMPQGKEYMVTALSVFFSFGAVLSAVVALLVIPQHSCPPDSPALAPCEDNKGWKYLLSALGLITLVMFLARMVLFRLHESPRYLVQAGRPQEALESLQMISKYNGDNFTIAIDDVDDTQQPPRSEEEEERPFLSTGRSDEEHSASPSPNNNYHSTGESETRLDGHAFVTPATEHVPPKEHSRRPTLTNTPIQRRVSTISTASSHYVGKTRICAGLPRWIRKPIQGMWDRVATVMSPDWIRTTLLVWLAWFSMSLAYTMFNVFLPKLLETKGRVPVPASGGTAAASSSIDSALWNVVIFTMGGCPGAILGAYMIETSLGRRWSLAGSTLATAFFCVVFIYVEASWAVRGTTMAISLCATTMWAVLYGWTPEIFTTDVRGTACGIASALSRVGGMIAPLVGGVLLMLNPAFPVYASIIVFVVAGLSALLLKEDSAPGAKGQGALVH